MSKAEDNKPNLSRRRFLVRSGAGIAATAVSGAAVAKGLPSVTSETVNPAHKVDSGPDYVPFYGTHQAGIITPQQSQSYFAAFDLVTDKRADVVSLLKAWTDAAARMTQGLPAEPWSHDPSKPPADDGVALGLSTANLTMTFGFGPDLFETDGNDRYGLARHRPAALADLPNFAGEQLVAAHCGGALSVHACADDAQIAFHAVRQLARIGQGTAQLRWALDGFTTANRRKDTPRNLMGFKDGTVNPRTPAARSEVVWVGSEGPAWMQGGSYLVSRRIRMDLEHWDTIPLNFQEKTFGRHKVSGAPLGAHNEFAPLDLQAKDGNGDYVIAQNAHVRLGAPSQNDGAQILRRAYNYTHGVREIAERWPPWKQTMAYEAGLLFNAYQKDPRTGFTKIFKNMALIDELNQFTTHVGSALFACPRGVEHEGDYIGSRLFAMT